MMNWFGYSAFVAYLESCWGGLAMWGTGAKRTVIADDADGCSYW
ncbi:MAG: hypothetical protein NT075_03775 [Chloroflexi bacterium]|nr:hypothetical protein [Chloroflexota bacterium]